MSLIDKWKSMAPKDRDEFLSNPNCFTSYEDKDYELAEAVAEDLRSLFDVDIGEIKIGNKGGYLLLLPIVPVENYDRANSFLVKKHLGFNVRLCKKT